MTDRLERALRATRERVTGESPDAEETLQRVLAERLAARRLWARRARMWIPMAAVLAFTTAALARWGSGPTLRALLAGRDEPGVALRAGPVPVASTQVPALPAAIAPIAPAPWVPTGAETPAPVPTTPSSARARALAATIASSASPVATADTPAGPSLSPAAISENDADAHAYARAHRLHFDGGDPVGALAAWDDYLSRFPAGRFAPDARYNRAIDLLKLRRYDEARAALQPFADGAVGGYHRDDARELLRSIP